MGIDYEVHASESSRQRTSDWADVLKLLKTRGTRSLLARYGDFVFGVAETLLGVPAVDSLLTRVRSLE
jgi:hypothetical protein